MFVPALLILVIFQTPHCLSVQSQLYKSSCSRHGDETSAEWNRVNVGESLKKWIESIELITEENLSDDNHEALIQIDDQGSFNFLSRIDPITRKPIGNAWVANDFNSLFNVFQNGFIYGPMDEQGTVTGDNVVYLYPDFTTALLGRFEKNVMIAAKTVKVVAERCENGIKVIRLSKPKKGAAIFKFQRPDRLRPGDQPTLRDPYEQKMVYVGNGVADDGVFAKRDIKSDELLCYYGGFITNTVTDPITIKNLSISERDEFERNLLFLSDVEMMDIPKGYWNLTQYRATLAHKVNHSFSHHNVRFVGVSHPRYGRIVAIMATQEIQKDQEVLINYGYNVGKNSPEWYKALYTKEFGLPIPDRSRD